MRRLGLLLAFLGLSVGATAAPAVPPAGSPILNSHVRQRNSMINIDTATITTVDLSTFTNTPSFPYGLSVNGAVYNSLGYGAGPGQFYDVYSYGAKGDGTTDDTAAVQRAHDAIVSSGKSGTLLVPGGTLKCNSGLTINMSFVSVLSYGAKFDFSGLAAGTTAFTLIGDTNNSYSGNPYYNADKYISNITAIGPGRTSRTWGMVLKTSGEPGPSHTKFYNVNLTAWGTGFYIGDNAYINAFYGCEVWLSSICFHMPFGTNSGERIYVNGGAFYNSETGMLLEQAISDVYVEGTSIDGMDVDYIRLAAGDLRMSKIHFEGNFCPDNCRVPLVRVPSTNAGAVYLGIDDSLLVVKSSRTVGAIQLEHTAYVTFTNNHVNNDGSNSVPMIISSFGAIGYLDTSGTINTSNDALFVDYTGNFQYWRNEVGSNMTTNKGIAWKANASANPPSTGEVGEYISSAVSSGNPVTAAASGNYYDVAQIYVSSGDWDVSGMSCLLLNTSTTTTYSGGIGTTAGNSASGLVHGANFFDVLPPTAVSDVCAPFPLIRALTSGATYYLKGVVTYSFGTPKSYGTIQARRRR